jgi:nucleotide-binding universal stress UspA family protein
MESHSRHGKETAMKKILIATDGSAPATTALELGLDLAADEEAKAFLVYVVPPLDSTSFGGFGLTTEGFVHEITEEEKAVLVEAADRAHSRGVDAETELLRGATVAEIVAYADFRDVDLIVIGSRGHGSLTSAVLGSVSHGVLRHTSRPVLIVRESAPLPAEIPADVVAA